MDVERLKSLEKGPEIPSPRVQGGELSVQERVPPQYEVAPARKALQQEVRREAERGGGKKDALLVGIESILSEGLSREYAQLTLQQKELFKKEGEQLAEWFHDAVRKGVVKPHRVLEGLEKWLLIIETKDRVSPWLLQEAYTRARRLLEEVRDNERGH